MNNYLKLLGIVYFLLISLKPNECKTPIPNGCGPKGFVINDELLAIGEGNLIQCCNQHDMCYGYCLGKVFCDDQFADCLVRQCNMLPGSKALKCKWDAFGMSSAVKVFGEPFYCRSSRNN